MNQGNVDPVTISVLWNTLLSITEEMGSAIKRTSFSEAVREGEDFSTGIFDRHGQIVAQGNFSPGHLGSMPYVVKSVMEYYPPGKMKPGDSIVLNDSFLGSGHFPDFFIVTPVFRDAEILGYVVNVAHHVDVGGMAPGSTAVQGVRDAFNEGLRVLPVKLVQNGEFDEDILRLILGNVRLPEKVQGDLRAQLNANFIGSQRLLRLFEDYGAEVVENSLKSILDRSEQRMRDLIRKIPDGQYSFEDCLDDSGPGTDPIRIHVEAKVAGDQVVVDFSKSSDQVVAGINSYINYTRAYTVFAIKVLADALLPHNDGVIRPVTATSRPGSFFNAVHPAPSGGRAAVSIRLYEAINGALAKALPERVLGGFSQPGSPNIGGVDDATGKRFVMHDIFLGGFGARSTKDGAEALCPVYNCSNIPVEVHEIHSPVRIHRLEFITDSGGAGMFRGGCGLRKDIELRNSRAILSLLGDRHRYPPYGLFGGHPGRLAETMLISDNETIALGSKEIRELKFGDVLSIRLSGGGGYGDPRGRKRSAVLEDLKDGYISEKNAAEHYHIEIKKNSEEK